MTTEPNDGLLYLQMYPHLRKWINQCVACQQLGYNPQMLAELDRPIALKKLATLLSSNAVRRCWAL